MKKTSATWIAATDYRTYAMLRWHFNGQVPVIQVNERGRYQGFADPGMEWVKGHPGLYVAREPDDKVPWFAGTTATAREGRARRSRLARRRDGFLRAGKDHRLDAGAVAAKGFPLFRWRVLAGDIGSSGFSAARLNVIASEAKQSIFPNVR